MSKVKVYQLPGYWGLPSISPFCLKLDSFLRMSGIPHKTVTVKTPFGGPKKKAPWIKYKGEKIGDSTLIIDDLMREFDVDPDKHLNDAERGEAVAIQRLVEENLYWAMVYDRWSREENWPILKETVLGAIPAPVRAVIAPRARRSTQQQLSGHGMGLHSAKEVAVIAQKDIDALAAILADKDWFFGDKLSMTDATVYSVLANIAYVPFASPMKAMIASHQKLAAWMKRFRDEVYPDSKAGVMATTISDKAKVAEPA